MYDEVKERSRAIWGKGDYSPASRQLEPASVSLVEALGIGPGMTVLDIAAGHGNCAVAAARRGAAVIATDFSPHMIEIGSARTRDADLDVQWQEADAADLPFPDASFERVTSTFGAVFAPEQDQVAAELVRVLRPDGLAGLTAWVPDGLTARAIAVSREFAPPLPEGTPNPFEWGDPDLVAAKFAPFGCTVETRRRALTFRFDSWEQWRRETESHGMAVVARETMDPERYAEMRDRMEAITAEADYGDGAAVAYDAEYLEIIVRKPV